MNGNPMKPMEQAADGILRSNSRQQPFDLLLFLSAETVELSPLSATADQTRPRPDPESQSILGIHGLTVLGYVAVKLRRQGKASDHGRHWLAGHTLHRESEKVVRFIRTVEAPVTPPLQAHPQLSVGANNVDVRPHIFLVYIAHLYLTDDQLPWR